MMESDSIWREAVTIRPGAVPTGGSVYLNHHHGLRHSVSAPTGYRLVDHAPAAPQQRTSIVEATPEKVTTPPSALPSPESDEEPQASVAAAKKKLALRKKKTPLARVEAKMFERPSGVLEERPSAERVSAQSAPSCGSIEDTQRASAATSVPSCEETMQHLTRQSSALATARRWGSQTNLTMRQRMVLPSARRQYGPRSVSYLEYTNPTSLDEEDGTYVHVYGGFETYWRVKEHVGNLKPPEGAGHLQSWKVMQWPDQPANVKMLSTVKRGSALSRAMTKAKRAIVPTDSKIYVTHVIMFDMCATVAIAESVGRCLVVALGTGKRFVHGNRGTVTGLPNFVQHAVLIDDAWLGERVADVFHAKCDALVTLFRSHYRSRRPTSDELRVPAAVMDVRIEEAVVNAYKLEPDVHTRDALESQRHALIHCFKTFPCSRVHASISGDVITIKVDTLPFSNVGCHVTSTDARLRRIVLSYVDDEREFARGEHIARWLTLFVARFTTSRSDADSRWANVLACIGHAPITLMHVVSCDVMPNLASSATIQGSTVLSVRPVFSSHEDDEDEDPDYMAPRKSTAGATAVPPMMIHDLVSTDDDTALACGLSLHTDIRCVTLDDDDDLYTIKPCCVTPGTSAYGMMCAVSLHRLGADRPDTYLNVA